MSKAKGPHSTEKSLVSIGIMFILVSIIVVKLMPNERMLPDLALILTIYCALYFQEGEGFILPIFAGAYVGSFSSFPIEYIGLYGMLYLGVRFISSLFQLGFVGYPIILSFVLEFLVGAIHALEIHLKQPDVFSFQVIAKIILWQSFLTALFLHPVFFMFDRFSQSPSSYFRHALK